MEKLLALAVMLTALMGCASTQRHESTGQYIDDTVITSKVKASILEESTLKVFDISVKSDNGVVKLSGFVDSAANVDRAGDVAAHVAGVTGVRNELSVK
jgi:osmotically-inducible protein OsmY